MDLNRVKEIIGSKDDIAVHYHGVPVWIEGIDDTGSLATVSARGNHDERRVVAIDVLEE
ncbi:H-type small acid-soluble spore protein [Bacillus sp. M6-12]|uniref:H-type small acid-soluble spore protein n=1 Tax=Bacillus sp. M6-12 TaxID=2054166 RepID=UPI000C76E1BE|nr:H-type small acid-soluble spore protein [Bacillus sp. M6-12]PLS17296.1 H-type small acid-soluble spore protein [Bacillus sp. M6-12]